MQTPDVRRLTAFLWTPVFAFAVVGCSSTTSGSKAVSACSLLTVVDVSTAMGQPAIHQPVPPQWPVTAAQSVCGWSAANRTASSQLTPLLVLTVSWHTKQVEGFRALVNAGYTRVTVDGTPSYWSSHPISQQVSTVQELLTAKKSGYVLLIEAINMTQGQVETAFAQTLRRI